MHEKTLVLFLKLVMITIKYEESLKNNIQILEGTHITKKEEIEDNLTRKINFLSFWSKPYLSLKTKILVHVRRHEHWRSLKVINALVYIKDTFFFFWKKATHITYIKFQWSFEMHIKMTGYLKYFGSRPFLELERYILSNSSQHSKLWSPRYNSKE